MRLKLRSIYARMLMVSAAATMLALVLAGLVMAGVLERFVTEGLDRRLDAQVLTLMSAVDADGRVNRAVLQSRAAALDGGPGWRWRIAGLGGAVGSADFPSLAEPPRPPHPPGPWVGGMHPADGADATGERVHARQVTLTTRNGPVTIVAAAPHDVIARPIRGAAMPLMLTLAALAALLAAATLVQLRVGLRPLKRLEGQVAAIRAGRLDRVETDQPTELRPLANELNALTADNQAALATARLSAANLAHALKTPVATLALEARDQPRQAALVARIDRTIRHHLARARADAIDRRSMTLLMPAAADLVTAVRRLHGADAPVFDVAIPDHLAVAVDPQDLDEMLGNLLDNAARHARSLVSLSAMSAARHVHIDIVDDGAGISAVEMARVAQPGTRLDERGEGYGFGLSIVSELAGLYGGALTLAKGQGGGLAARITLPSA